MGRREERKARFPSFFLCVRVALRFPFSSSRPPRDTKRPLRGRKEREITSKCSEKAIFRVSLFLQSHLLKATTKRMRRLSGRLREVITYENIGQQKVSFENRPCTFWKKIRCMQFISLDMLWRSSYPLSSEADTVYRDQTTCQVVAYRRLKQRRIIELASNVLTVAYEVVVVYERFELQSFVGKNLSVLDRSSHMGDGRLHGVLGWVVYHIFLPMVLRCALRARAPL